MGLLLGVVLLLFCFSFFLIYDPLGIAVFVFDICRRYCVVVVCTRKDGRILMGSFFALSHYVSLSLSLSLAVVAAKRLL